MNAITLKNLSFSYQNRPVLKDLNLTVLQGQRVVILGDSGCGKTSLLHLISGLSLPSKGEIYLHDTLVSTQNKILIQPHKRHLNMVFQDLALWPHLSVQENLSFALKAQGMKRELIEQKVKTMLELVELTQSRAKKPHALSGGEQQRVAIARALINEPKILLMDEPLSSLNQELSQTLQTELIKLQKRLGFTLVYVTHNIAEALNIATHIVLMKEGEINFYGTRAQYQASFLTKHTH